MLAEVIALGIIFYYLLKLYFDYKLKLIAIEKGNLEIYEKFKELERKEMKEEAKLAYRIIVIFFIALTALLIIFLFKS